MLQLQEELHKDAATAKRLLCIVLFFVFVVDFALVDPGHNFKVLPIEYQKL